MHSAINYLILNGITNFQKKYRYLHHSNIIGHVENNTWRMPISWFCRKNILIPNRIWLKY